MKLLRDINYCLNYKRLRLAFASAAVEVRARYRRSTLDLFWLVSAFTIRVIGIGIIYSEVFSVDPQEYLPFLAIGLLLWSFISGLLNSSCVALIRSERYLMQFQLPATIYILKEAVKEVSTLTLHVPVVFLVFAILGVLPGPTEILWSLLGFAALFWTCSSIMIILALATPFIRDIQFLVSSVVLLFFLITPVLWQPSMLEPDSPYLQLNPFYHLLAVVRDPILHGSPNFSSMVIVCAMAIVLSGAAIVVYQVAVGRVTLHLR